MLDDDQLKVFDKAAKMSMGAEQPPAIPAAVRPNNDGNYKKYFAGHIKSDMTYIQSLIKLQSIAEVIDWFKAVQIRMADMIMNSENVDASSGMYLDRSIFAAPLNIIRD